jgi:hypothetical protein
MDQPQGLGLDLPVNVMVGRKQTERKRMENDGDGGE